MKEAGSGWWRLHWLVWCVGGASHKAWILATSLHGFDIISLLHLVSLWIVLLAVYYLYIMVVSCFHFECVCV